MTVPKVETDFEEFAQHTVRRTDDYLFEFEEYRRPTDDAQMLIAHIRVFRWSPSVLKQMKQEWELLRSVIRSDIYATPPEDTPLWRKFVETFGFTYFRQVICNDGLPRPLYISRVTDVVPTNDELKLVKPAGVCPSGSRAHHGV